MRSKSYKTKEDEMRGKFFAQAWVWSIIILALVLVSLPAAHGQELAKEQVCYLGARDQDVGTLDPYFALKWSEIPIMNLVHEGLLAWPRGNFDVDKLIPALAERWEASPDGLTWTFYLRKGVKWHGGYGEFTAEDVKFSIERALDPKVGSPFKLPLKPIEKVTVVDPYTVKIKTRFPVATLPKIMINYRSGYIMCKKACEKLGRDIKFHPIGTGPFAFKEYRPREGITFVAHEGYWRGAPIIKRLEVMFVPEASTREMALRKGELDGINIPAKQEWIDRLRKDGFDVTLTMPADMSVLHFNITKKPLDNVKVRRALCHAINRDEFLHFFGKDVLISEYAPVPHWYVGWTKDIVTYEYDPEKAKRLLAEAGYPNGFKMEVVISNRATYLPPMQIVQEMWKKIGVNMELKPVDHPSYHKLIRTDVNPVIWYNSNRYPFTGNTQLVNFYHSNAIIGKPTAIVNFSHYSCIDTLIDDAYSEPNAEKQKALWIKAQQMITREAISYTVYVRRFAMAKWPYLDLGFEQLSQEHYDIRECTRILKH